MYNLGGLIQPAGHQLINTEIQSLYLWMKYVDHKIRRSDIGTKIKTAKSV